MYVTLSAKRLHNSLGYLVHNSLVVTWFERARAIERAFVVDDWVGIDKRKLDAIYQFIRAMPDVFEPAPAAGEKRKQSAVDA